MKKTKYVLTDIESSTNPSSTELANVVLERMGLVPRKSGSNKNMHMVLVELYERSKFASREKDPQMGIMTVEEMANSVGITRQTMYDYLKRWLELQLIKKLSFMKEGVLVVGYHLNGSNIENAFSKARSMISMNLDGTERYIKMLQNELKKDKLRKINAPENIEPEEQETSSDEPENEAGEE